MRKRSKGISPLTARLFPLPFVLVGVVTLAFGIRNVCSAWASSSWPKTPGQITSSEVRKSTSHSSGKHGSGTSTTYRADVTYSYTVNGAPHEGKTVAFGDYGSSNRSHASGIVGRYPVGREVDVFYAPSSPSRSVLEPGIKLQAFFLPAFGTIFAAAGTAMLIFLPRMARRQPRGSDGERASEHGAASRIPPETGR